MSELISFNLDSGKAGSKVSASDVVFKRPLRLDLLNEYVVMQRRRRRQGTASTLTRAEVSGTGKKPFRQKGTGNARQGTLRGPHQYHGGVAFGPKPREYYSSLNKKMKKECLRVALSQKNFEKKLHIIDEFEISSGKTKDLVKKLGEFSKSALILGDFSEKTQLAGRNMKKVNFLKAEALNVEDVLAHDWLLMTKKALEWCESHLTKEESTKARVA